MSADLHELDAWAAGLLSSLSPSARKMLVGEIARRLRETSQARILAQINSDGTPYEKRKQQKRAKVGRVRRKMFTKLRTNRYLKVEASSDGAFVAFAGQAQRIARVHHFGLRDRVEKNGPTVKYAARELLGITDGDQDTIADLIVKSIAKR